jgi:ABC-2 type transport system permease protein
MDMVYRASSDPAMQNFEPNGPQDVLALFSAKYAWGAVASPDLWLGAAAGIAMLFGAVYFRRSRDEG